MTNNDLDIFIEMVALHKTNPESDAMEAKIRNELELLAIIKKYAYEINFVIDNPQTKRVEDWLYQEDVIEDPVPDDEEA